MSYLIFFITFLVSLFGLVFKTTEEDKETGKKRLNKWGISVLILMIVGVSVNMYVKRNDTISAKAKEMSLQYKKKDDSLRMVTIKDSTIKSLNYSQKNLMAAQRNLSSSQEQISILKDNVKLQKKNGYLTDVFNKYLRHQLDVSVLELNRIKSPVDSLLLKIEIVFNLNEDLNKKIYDVLMNNKVTVFEYTTLITFNDMRDFFPQLDSDINNLYIETEHYQFKDLSPEKSIYALTNNYYLGNNHLKLWPINYIFFEYNRKEKYLKFTIDELKSSIMSNLTRFQSFKEFCNSNLRVRIKLKANSELLFLPNSLVINKLSLIPKRSERSMNGFYFYISNENTVDDEYSLASYLLTKCDCAF